MISRHPKTAPVIIALFLLFFMLTGCGPSQEELTVGALKHFHRGNQLYSEDRPQAAIAEYKMAIAQDNQQAIFYYNLGRAYYRLVLYEQSIEAYQAAIDKNPELEEAWYNLSLALDKVGETDKAFLAYEKYQMLSRARQQAKPEPDAPKPVILKKPGSAVTGKQE
ncbi:tetratricopeptide repeat protein [bacterium]|nr:tetratricopeptide repeat protein [bacterium]